MRYNSGRDELEHSAFQVEIYSGERESWAGLQPAACGKVCAAGAACLSTFSV